MNNAAHASPIWEIIVPVTGRVLTLQIGPGVIPITGLRRAMPPATSSDEKPLYMAVVATNSQGVPVLHQLFEFTQTALNAGMFQPVPTVGGHIEGVYGLEYARHRFAGSTAGLPELLRWPASPTAVCFPPVPWDRHQPPVEGPLHHHLAAAPNPARPTDAARPARKRKRTTKSNSAVPAAARRRTSRRQAVLAPESVGLKASPGIPAPRRKDRSAKARASKQAS